VLEQRGERLENENIIKAKAKQKVPLGPSGLVLLLLRCVTEMRDLCCV
jgi:hypothetical protein